MNGAEFASETAFGNGTTLHYMRGGEGYFRYFFDIGTVEDHVVTDAEIEHYVTAYGDPARLHAAFEMYRAIPETAGFNNAHRTPVGVSLLLVGGEQVAASCATLSAK